MRLHARPDVTTVVAPAFQLEEAAVSLLRRLQPRGTEDEEEAGAAEIAGLQVLLCGSRQFGPASLRELTVRGRRPWWSAAHADHGMQGSGHLLHALLRRARGSTPAASSRLAAMPCRHRNPCKALSGRTGAPAVRERVAAGHGAGHRHGGIQAQGAPAALRTPPPRPPRLEPMTSCAAAVLPQAPAWSLHCSLLQ